MTATMTARCHTADLGELSARLTALGSLVEIGAARTGPDGFSEELLAAAGDVLTRAGQRLDAVLPAHRGLARGRYRQRQSSLFNRLSGADSRPSG